MNLKKQFTIEKAKLSEGNIAAKLIHIAYKDMSNKMLGTNDKNLIHKYYKELWEKDVSRFTWKNSYTIKDGDKIAGLITYCPGKDVKKYDTITINHILKKNFFSYLWYVLKNLNYLFNSFRTLEAEKTEHCLLVLSILPEYQGHGLGSKLMEHLDSVVKESKHNVSSLLCSSVDSATIRFYERCGYQIKSHLNKKPYNYYKMTKTIG